MTKRVSPIERVRADIDQPLDFADFVGLLRGQRSDAEEVGAEDHGLQRPGVLAAAER